MFQQLFCYSKQAAQSVPTTPDPRHGGGTVNSVGPVKVLSREAFRQFSASTAKSSVTDSSRVGTGGGTRIRRALRSLFHASGLDFRA